MNDIQKPRVTGDRARVLLIVAAGLLFAGAIVSILLAVIPNSHIATDADKETTRNVGLALLAGAGACFLPFINLLASAIEGAEATAAQLERLEKELLTKAQLEAALENYRHELASVDRSQQRDEQAIVEFREHYETTIKPTMIAYATEVTLLKDEELLRRFDALLEVRNLLVRELRALKSKMFIEKEEDVLLASLESNCKRLLLVTRFPEAIDQQRLKRYENSVRETNTEFAKIDQQLHHWMKKRMRPRSMPGGSSSSHTP